MDYGQLTHQHTQRHNGRHNNQETLYHGDTIVNRRCNISGDVVNFLLRCKGLVSSLFWIDGIPRVLAEGL